MRQLIFVALALAALGLGACKRPGSFFDGAGSAHHGRYLGVGVYATGSMWSKMVAAGQSAEPGKAKIADDEHVIVVVDSQTGEVRQCGDLSGYCIGMNPWSAPLDGSRAGPVSISQHAAPASDAAAASDAPAAPASSAAPVQGPKP